MTAVTHFALARPYRLSLDSYARVTGVHPELVRRLVALGLLDVTRDAQGRLWFDPSQVKEMARIQRLRMSLNLGYSAIGLVVELLDRIARAGEDATADVTTNVTTRRRSMDMNRLTQKSQEALHDAQTKALRFGHVEVDGEHLLLALLDQGEGLVAPCSPGREPIPTGSARTWRPSSAAAPRVSGPGVTPGQVHITQRLSRLLDTADREAAQAQGRVRLGRAPA